MKTNPNPEFRKQSPVRESDREAEEDNRQRKGVMKKAEDDMVKFSGHERFLKDLWNSRLTDSTFANVRIIPSDKNTALFAHSAALTLASDYLKQLLLAAEPDEDGIYQICLPDFATEAVKALLRLIYTGRTVGDIGNVMVVGNVIGLAMEADEEEREAGASDDAAECLQSPESEVPSPMHDESSPNGEQEEEDINEDSVTKDDFALTVKLEENLSRAKFQDGKKRRRKSSTSVAMLASAAASTVNTAAQPPPKGKRVLMADLDRSQLTCGVCGKEFQVMYKLKLHKLIHSSSPPFVCALCGKGFNNKYKMRVHEKNHGNASNASSKAGVGKNAADDNDENLPVEPKRKADSNSCKFCSAPEFKTKAALNAHLGAAHPNFRRFLCSMCGKGFKGQKGLDHHTNFVCGRGAGSGSEKAYPCTECHAKFGSPRDVRRHMATHGPRQGSIRI